MYDVNSLIVLIVSFFSQNLFLASLVTSYPLGEYATSGDCTNWLQTLTISKIEDLISKCAFCYMLLENICHFCVYISTFYMLSSMSFPLTVLSIHQFHTESGKVND